MVLKTYDDIAHSINKYLSHHKNAGKMVKTLSKELGLQIIMVTHSMGFSDYADKIFEVKKNNEVSAIKELS